MLYKHRIWVILANKKLIGLQVEFLIGLMVLIKIRIDDYGSNEQSQVVYFIFTLLTICGFFLVHNCTVRLAMSFGTHWQKYII